MLLESSLSTDLLTPKTSRLQIEFVGDGSRLQRGLRRLVEMIGGDPGLGAGGMRVRKGF
jgi:hypothetical protein